MIKYIKILFYFIFPNYKNVRDLYYDDVLFIINYLKKLEPETKISFSKFLANVSTVTPIAKFKNYSIIKIAIYKKWDLAKEFMPKDTAWLIIDNDDVLKFMSFDKDLFYKMIGKYI